MNWHELKYKNTSQFTDIHTTREVNETFTRSLGNITYRAAAYAKGLGDQTTIHHDTADSCVYGNSEYVITNSSTPVHYRLTITVKTT